MNTKHIALPWRPIDPDNDSMWARRIFDSGNMQKPFFSVERIDFSHALRGEWWAPLIIGWHRKYPSKEKAMIDVDEFLVGAGWYLVPEMEEERFMEKLMLLL